MRSRRPRSLGRAASRAATVAVLLASAAACTGTRTGDDNSGDDSGDTSAPTTGATPTTLATAGELLAASSPPSFTPWDTATPDEAAAIELAIVEQWRLDADFAGQLGPDGDQVLANFDEARRAFAEDHVGPAFAAIAQQAAPTPVGFRAAQRQTSAPSPSSFLGDIGATTTMTAAVMSIAVVSLADSEPGTWTDDGREEYRPRRDDGNTELIVVTQRTNVQSGGGRVRLQVDIDTTATVSDAGGAIVASVSGTGRIIFDVLACPEADGRAPGEYDISYNETAGSRSRSFAASAPFTLHDGDDAALQSIDIQFDVSRNASQDGVATSSQGTMTGTSSSNGSMSYGEGSVTANGTPVDQAASALGSTVGLLGATVQQVGKAAETFWRSGKCIELQPSETTREVDPREELSIDTRSVGRFDRAEIDAPIRATLSGPATVEPADTPQDPPATVTYTAGEHPGDRGTITFKQVGRRGIGTIEETFTVRQQDLLLDVSGTGSTTVPGGSVTGTTTVTGAVLTLDTATGRYEAPSFPIQLELTIGLPGCPGAASFTRTGSITATPDEADPDTLTLEFRPAQFDLATVSCTIGPRTVDLPVAPYEAGWALALQGQTVRVGEPKPFSYTANDAGGAYTVDFTLTLSRPDPAA